LSTAHHVLDLNSPHHLFFLPSFLPSSSASPSNITRLNISSHPGFHVTPSTVNIDSLHGSSGRSSTPYSIDVIIRTKTHILPSDRNVVVSVVGLTEKGVARTCDSTFQVPFGLVGRIVPPIKNCRYMITLDTNRPPPSLIDIFPKLIGSACENNPDLRNSSAAVMTIIFHGEESDATILVSKKAGRYRIQGGRLDALYLLTSELADRLTDHFRRKGDTSFEVSFKEQLPFGDYFTVIDQHLHVRHAITQTAHLIENASVQFRVVQKRLLARYRDKNAGPLHGMDKLLDMSYAAVMKQATRMQTLRIQLQRLDRQLSGATRLMLLLVCFKGNVNAASSDILEQHLSPLVNDHDQADVECGWEEHVQSTLTYLLKTVLAKSSKELNISLPKPETRMTDTTKLKKLIQTVLERVAHGASLVSHDAQSSTSESL
jgi:Bardet-Biedl syndrome 9 protein